MRPSVLTCVLAVFLASLGLPAPARAAAATVPRELALPGGYGWIQVDTGDHSVWTVVGGSSDDPYGYPVVSPASVHVLQPTTGAAATYVVNSPVTDLRVDPAHHEAWVATAGTLTLLDDGGHLVHAWQVPGFHDRFALDPDGRVAYLVDPDGQTLTVVTAGSTAVSTTPLAHPDAQAAVGVDAKHHRLVLGNSAGQAFDLVDLPSLAVAGSFTDGAPYRQGQPSSVLVDTVSGALVGTWAFGPGYRHVTSVAVRLPSGTVVTPLQPNEDASSLAVDPARHRVLVPSSGAGLLSVDDVGGAVTTLAGVAPEPGGSIVPGGYGPYSAALDTSTGAVWTTVVEHDADGAVARDPNGQVRSVLTSVAPDGTLGPALTGTGYLAIDPGLGVLYVGARTYHVDGSDPALTITGQPAATTVRQGTSTSLTVLAAGAATVAWQLSQDGGTTWISLYTELGGQSVLDGTTVLGGSRLDRPLVVAADVAGLYRAVLTDVAGVTTTTAPAQLTVTVPSSPDLAGTVSDDIDGDGTLGSHEPVVGGTYVQAATACGKTDYSGYGAHTVADADGRWTIPGSQLLGGCDYTLAFSLTPYSAPAEVSHAAGLDAANPYQVVVPWNRRGALSEVDLTGVGDVIGGVVIDADAVLNGSSEVAAQLAGVRFTLTPTGLCATPDSRSSVAITAPGNPTYEIYWVGAVAAGCTLDETIDLSSLPSGYHVAAISDGAVAVVAPNVTTVHIAPRADGILAWAVTSKPFAPGVPTSVPSPTFPVPVVGTPPDPEPTAPVVPPAAAPGTRLVARSGASGGLTGQTRSGGAPAAAQGRGVTQAAPGPLGRTVGGAAPVQPHVLTGAVTTGAQALVTTGQAAVGPESVQAAAAAVVSRVDGLTATGMPAEVAAAVEPSAPAPDRAAAGATVAPAQAPVVQAPVVRVQVTEQVAALPVVLARRRPDLRLLLGTALAALVVLPVLRRRPRR